MCFTERQIVEMNIYFFGDSISFGQGVSVSKTWVTSTARYLQEKYPEENIMVNNPSVNGNTTRMALERMPHDIQDKSVDILVVEFGMNDCNYWMTDKGVPRVSEMGFKANLHEIFQRGFCVARAKRIVMLTNHISGKTEKLPYTETTYQLSNERYNQLIREVVEEWDEKVLMIDIEKAYMEYFDTFAGNRRKEIERLLLPDLVHLSEQGHDFYYKIFIKQFEAIVKTVIV